MSRLRHERNNMFDNYLKRLVPNDAIYTLETYADEHGFGRRWMSAFYLELIIIEREGYDLSFCIDETFENRQFIISNMEFRTYISSIHEETDEKIFTDEDYKKAEAVSRDFLKVLFKE